MAFWSEVRIAAPILALVAVAMVALRGVRTLDDWVFLACFVAACIALMVMAFVRQRAINHTWHVFYGTVDAVGAATTPHLHVPSVGEGEEIAVRRVPVYFVGDESYVWLPIETYQRHQRELRPGTELTIARQSQRLGSHVYQCHFLA
jgi:hypothetical protein